MKVRRRETDNVMNVNSFARRFRASWRFRES